jgi:hypothetical protein
MNTPGSAFLRIAGICAFGGPILMVIGDLMHIFAGFDFVWTIVMWSAMMMMIPATIGFTYLVAKGGGSLALVGGILAYFGLLAGASMQVLFRVYAVLSEAGSTATIRQLGSTFKLVASTQIIGIAWPVGLLILSLICFRVRSISSIVPIVLIIGAITFPIGRIGDQGWAVILSGVTFVIGYGMLAQRLFQEANAASGGSAVAD